MRVKGGLSIQENIFFTEEKETSYRDIDKKPDQENELQNFENDNKEEEKYKEMIKDEELKLEEKRFQLSIENALNFYEKEELIEFFKIINNNVLIELTFRKN